MQFAKLQLDKMYFTTSTILNWHHLLKNDNLKQKIIDSLIYLTSNKLIEIYAFVIMPNHLDIIWKMIAINKKEMPNVSFMKYTGHSFLKELKEKHPKVLPYFEVNSSTREYHFWQRNSFSIELYTSKVIIQKINYIHQNPIQDKWKLADLPENYKWSSANFYHSSIDNFGFLKH